MIVSVGDVVRFLNEVGGGVVTRVEKNIAFVLLDEGFEVPAKMSDIVVVTKAKQVKKEEVLMSKTPNLGINIKPEVKIETVVKKDIETHATTEDDEVLIALLNESQSIENFNLNLYLVNNSNFYLQYVIGVYINNSHKLLDYGVLEPTLKIKISKIGKDIINNLSGFTVQIVRFKKSNYEPQAVIDDEIKLKPYKLFTENSFVNNDYFDEPALVIPLNFSILEKHVNKIDPAELSNIVKEKETKPEDVSQKFKKRAEPFLVEVDLHIHELIENSKSLTNGEMLEIQLSKFREELENAIQKRVNKIVFIHGVGNGTLKMAIRKQLDEFYKHLQYHDASFKEYGYGATMVTIRR